MWHLNGSDSSIMPLTQQATETRSFHTPLQTGHSCGVSTCGFKKNRRNVHERVCSSVIPIPDHLAQQEEGRKREKQRWLVHAKKLIGSRLPSCQRVTAMQLRETVLNGFRVLHRTNVYCEKVPSFTTGASCALLATQEEQSCRSVSQATFTT